MRLVAMTLCGGAVLAAGVLAFSDGYTEEPTRFSLRPMEAPAYPQGADLRQRFAQVYGTVCQTPAGSVCTVAPQLMNSRCDCGGTSGVIVR